MTTTLSKRLLVGAASAATVVAALTVGGTAASADLQPVGASGTSIIQISPQVIKTLQAGECGALSAVGTGNGVVSSNGRGRVSVKLPVTGLVTNPENGALRIQHAGSGVELSNDCWDVRMSNFYIQNLGQADQTEGFDVDAITKTADGQDRESIFTLSLENATYTISRHGALRVYGADLALGDDGANQFNELATGNSPDEAGNVDGPFYAGEAAGKARTSIRFDYGPPAA